VNFDPPSGSINAVYGELMQALEPLPDDALLADRVEIVGGILDLLTGPPETALARIAALKILTGREKRPRGEVAHGLAISAKRLHDHVVAMSRRTGIPSRQRRAGGGRKAR